MSTSHNIQYFPKYDINPNENIGLARLEYIVSSCIGIHPRALLDYGGLCLSADIQAQIKPYIANYNDPCEFYIKRLADGIATIAACFYPEPLVLRISDFRSHEYATLIGGMQYAPTKVQNTTHFYSDEFSECFAMDCAAIKKVREEMEFTNLKVMLPFVYSTEEKRDALKTMEKNGLQQGENGLEIIVRCETPSNALLVEQFFENCDCSPLTLLGACPSNSN